MRLISQWVRGKSLDTFCPMGPGIVTADEIGDPQRLSIRATVNDDLVQGASTAKMSFPVAEIERIGRLENVCRVEVVETAA